MEYITILTCACVYEQLYNLHAVISSSVVEWSETFLVEIVYNWSSSL